MIIVADSGSTKTDWLIGNDLKSAKRLRTEGLNPYFVNNEQLRQVLHTMILELDDPMAITGIYFYGAGLSNDQEVFRFRQAFQQCFPNAEIRVEHDLLGACFAACSGEDGMVGILGTGANSCVFSEGEIIQNVPSLGYVLGDEGSGADIGKRLLHHCLLDQGKGKLSAALMEDLDMNHDEIIARVYQGGLANRWMAKLTTFAVQHRKDEMVQKILNAAFSDFLDHYICRYPQHKSWPLHMVGSIAIVFQDELQRACEARGVKLGRMVKRPIEPLFEHHL